MEHPRPDNRQYDALLLKKAQGWIAYIYRIDKQQYICEIGPDQDKARVERLTEDTLYRCEYL